MGSSEAWIFWSRLYEIIWGELTKEQKKTLLKNPAERARALIEEQYEKLVQYVIDQKSRLAYQTLAVFLMCYGAKMTNEERAERFSHLSDFHNRVKNYREGQVVTIYYESPSSVIDKLRQQGIIITDYPFISTPLKNPIDYHIKD